MGAYGFQRRQPLGDVHQGRAPAPRFRGRSRQGCAIDCSTIGTRTSSRRLHAARRADIPPTHGDPFDRMLLAQAIPRGMTLITADRVLAGYGEADAQSLESRSSSETAVAVLELLARAAGAGGVALDADQQFRVDRAAAADRPRRHRRPRRRPARRLRRRRPPMVPRDVARRHRSRRSSDRCGSR